MRVLLNGLPMFRTRTGIGQYGAELLRALLASEQLEEIGVFTGFSIVSLRDGQPDAAASTAPALSRGLRNLPRLLGPLKRELLDRWRAWRVSRAMRQSRWNLFHETNFVGPRAPLPLVTTIHDLGHLRFPQFVPKDRLRWMRRGFDDTLARARAIVVDSEFTRRELLELCTRVDEGRIFVAHLGVDRARFQASTEEQRQEVRGRYGLPPQFVLYLGTLEPRKNPQGLLRAYARLPQELQHQFPLVLAGMSDGRNPQFQQDLANLTSRGVAFPVGYVAQSDVPLLMQSASVFCFPSFYEGFGLPPLEAAACGTPVLCSRAGSLPEVMGDAAEYVDPNSEDEIRLGLQRLLEDGSLRQSLARRGPPRAARYSWQDCARRTLAAYRSAA